MAATRCPIIIFAELDSIKLHILTVNKKQQNLKAVPKTKRTCPNITFTLRTVVCFLINFFVAFTLLRLTKWYCDENHIFPIEPILKHKQVACVTRKTALYYFQISLFVPEIFKFLKYANYFKLANYWPVTSIMLLINLRAESTENPFHRPSHASSKNLKEKLLFRY